MEFDASGAVEIDFVRLARRFVHSTEQGERSDIGQSPSGSTT